MYESLRGNKNAEKWTEEQAINLYSDLCDKARANNNYLLINVLSGVITIDQHEYIKAKFKDSKTVSQLIKELTDICESNLTEAMLNGKVKETASIFLLKAKYGYIDKQQIEHEHKGSININLQFPE